MQFQKIYLKSTKTKARRNIILKLDRPKTATELAEDLGYNDTPAVSNLLRLLKDAGAIKCLTPERHKDRQYYLTPEGKRTRRILLGEEEF